DADPAPAHSSRVVIIGEREMVAGVEPTVVGVAEAVEGSDVDHEPDLGSFLTSSSVINVTECLRAEASIPPLQLRSATEERCRRRRSTRKHRARQTGDARSRHGARHLPEAGRAAPCPRCSLARNPAGGGTTVARSQPAGYWHRT